MLGALLSVKSSSVNLTITRIDSLTYFLPRFMFISLEKYEHFQHWIENNIGMFVIEHLTEDRFKYVISKQ